MSDLNGLGVKILPLSQSRYRLLLDKFPDALAWRRIAVFST